MRLTGKTSQLQPRTSVRAECFAWGIKPYFLGVESGFRLRMSWHDNLMRGCRSTAQTEQLCASSKHPTGEREQFKRRVL